MSAAARKHSVGGRLSFIFACLFLISGFAAPSALAHGEHGEAAPVFGGMSLFSFDGFQVEFLGSPRPLRIGADNKIIAKILRDGSLEPVRNGKVYMGVLPARLLNRFAAPDKASTVKADRFEVPLSPAPEKVWAGN